MSNDHLMSEQTDVVNETTPQEAVIFLREEGRKEFMPIHHHHSITLHELAQEYNISSVLECDAEGKVAARAVAFDSPSDVLHSGKHYIAKRAIHTGDGENENRVTFRSKITVQEYELENPTPLSTISSESDASVSSNGFATPASSLFESLTTSSSSSSYSSSSEYQEKLSAALFTDAVGERSVLGSTPLPSVQNTMSNVDEDNTTIRNNNDENEKENTNREDNTRTMTLPKTKNEAMESRIASTDLHEVRQASSMKRERDDEEEGNYIANTNVHNDKQIVLTSEESTTASIIRMQEENDKVGALHELTNSIHTTQLPVKQKSKTRVCTIDDVEVEIPTRTRFIPFQADLHDNGKPVIVTLKDLQLYCDNIDKEESKFAEDHSKAEEIISKARSLLSSLTKKEESK